MMCMPTQPDIVYVPRRFARSWARVAQRMTSFGVPFPIVFHTAAVSVSSSWDDIEELRTRYAGVMLISKPGRNRRARTLEKVLDQARGMDVLHPFKFSNQLHREYAVQSTQRMCNATLHGKGADFWSSQVWVMSS
eukprot:NODE_5458_length_674_cov_40.929600_g5083_i0.p1 GENE.NODE_5458_length_674_cov_40.929600_g5083_i0~~NODE_5458_length_674_cov_40.929600_g5083_i0.p1  ORF type:complete len:135 (+),score=11.74 NODE_5458_length_674_cov_40.929600_g5083_i0:207-611(+)